MPGLDLGPQSDPAAPGSLSRLDQPGRTAPEFGSGRCIGSGSAQRRRSPRRCTLLFRPARQTLEPVNAWPRASRKLVERPTETATTATRPDRFGGCTAGLRDRTIGTRSARLVRNGHISNCVCLQFVIPIVIRSWLIGFSAAPSDTPSVRGSVSTPCAQHGAQVQARTRSPAAAVSVPRWDGCSGRSKTVPS